MKKFFAAVSCTLLIAGMSIAQEATPVADTVQAAAADAVQAATTEETPAAAAEAAPVAVPEAAPVAAATMTADIVEGTIVNSPIACEYSIALIQSGCGCNGGVPAIGLPVVSAPIVAADPMISVPAASPCGCDAAPAPAPVASCGCEAPAAAPACCQPRQRRQIVRGAVSNLRSRRSSCCCN